MNKLKIIKSLSDNQDTFLKYIAGLTQEEYAYRYQLKWTAGQRLELIVLCIQPILQVFSLDKKVIVQTFGRTVRQGLSYAILTNQYIEKFKAGGKAPDRYPPETISAKQRKKSGASLLKMINEFCAKIKTFIEKGIDGLLIPYPLLHYLTLRGMLYNSIYHVTHHQNKSMKYLMNKYAPIKKQV